MQNHPQQRTQYLQTSMVVGLTEWIWKRERGGWMQPLVAPFLFIILITSTSEEPRVRERRHVVVTAHVWRVMSMMSLCRQCVTWARSRELEAGCPFLSWRRSPQQQQQPQQRKGY